MSQKDQRQALVDTFINSIYLYDDKVLITFNYKEGTQTVTFGEATEVASEGNGSDLDCFTAPRKTSTHCVLVFLFCLRDGRGSNKAAAHSAASNQPSGLLLSPRVPTRRNVYRGSCKSKDFMAFLFCKPWLHGFCTVFARSVFSMSDYVGRCIALQSVPFFASGEQCQAQFCLHFRVGILEQFQKSRHGDGGFACGGYSLRAGGVGLGIEVAFKLNQPEPRCNTLDFASKVVCQRGAASRLSARSGASKCTAF